MKRKQFEIWLDKKIGMWVARYTKYPGIVGIDTDPPRALRTLIYNYEKAMKDGKEVRVE